jgi:hypothetical protein
MRGKVAAMQGDAGSKCRNWQEYDESLVKRGEMYLTFDFIENWDQGFRRAQSRQARQKLRISLGFYRAINANTRDFSSAV